MPFRRPKKTGPWYTDIRPRVAGKPTGKRIRLLMPHVRTKPEAIEEERRIAIELREGKAAASVNFASFVREHFLPWADQNKQAPIHDHTRANYLIDFFGEKTLPEISIFNIEQYKRERAKSKTTRKDFRAPGTINNELSTLSRILNMAVQGGLIKQNPMADVKPLEQASWRTRSLSAAEEERLLQHARSPTYLRDLIRFALLTGLRQAEMLDLKWEYVRLDRALIYLVHTKWKEDPRKTKGLPISEEACELLKSLPRNGPLVFPNFKGGRIFSTNLTQCFMRARTRAKVEDFHFHDLRHTFGTRMAESGIKLHKLQRLMGHQDPKMTMRYIHVDEEELRDALKSATPFLMRNGHSADTEDLREAV